MTRYFTESAVSKHLTSDRFRVSEMIRGPWQNGPGGEQTSATYIERGAYT